MCVTPYASTHAAMRTVRISPTYKLQSNLSFYAQAGYQFAVAPTNVQRDGVKGNIGLRYTW